METIVIKLKDFVEFKLNDETIRGEVVKIEGSVGNFLLDLHYYGMDGRVHTIRLNEREVTFASCGYGEESCRQGRWYCFEHGAIGRALRRREFSPDGKLSDD